MQQERLDKYDLIKEIGAGVSSKVKLGFNSETGESAAFKILTNMTSEVHRATFKNEVSMLRGLEHPNLINIRRYYDEADLEEGNCSSKKVTAIALEFAPNGDMCQYMETSGRFSENVARFYFRQIIEALEYCHQRGIMHRDVKPENLLFDENFNLKIADFGFAKFLNERSGKLSLHTALGTDGYMAPEMHVGKPYDGRGIDLFAAGVVLFLMIVGHPPFGRADPRDSFYKFITKQREDLFWKYHIQCMDCKEEDKESLISDDLKTLISPMLALDPNERFSIKEIKEHVWYDGPLPTREELLKEMLQKRSKLASASDDALQDSIESVVPLPESNEEQKNASDAP